MKKQTIAIVAGGKSTEHQVSLISAKNIAAV
jgi:D-alanine-D-alanine ligase-like ATP-grasp enzyme